MLFNSIELVQIRPNESVKDTTLVIWNNTVKSWRKKCIPHIRSNAINWPIMKRENIEQVKAFFEWLKDMNDTRAYKVAYKTVKTDKIAGVNAARLLGNDSVKKYIQEKQKEREKRTEITQDMVIKELAKLAFIDRTDIVKLGKTRNGETKVIIQSTDDLRAEQRAIISGIKETKNGIEVTFYSKEKALELLGRHLGMFNDKLQLTGEIKTSNPFSGLSTDELRDLINHEN